MLPDNCDVVCILHWDDALYQEALGWVNETRQVEIFCPFEKISSDPRVKIHHLESPIQEKLLLRKVAWSTVLKRLHVIGDNALKEQLQECHRAAHGILSDAADDWVGILKNAFANQTPYRRGMELAGVFPKVPALIIGAGPSLEKYRSSLSAFQDRALIFAGGTALSLIDIQPDFAAAIDPIAPGKKGSQAPFCYQARMHPDNLALMKKERLLFPDSASSALNWIYGETNQDFGWTVGTFMTAVALLMGCSPILFVGMDLCYEEGKKYAFGDASSLEGLIETQGVLTQKDWWLAARWIEAKKGPFFDMSSGILKLPKIGLQEALDLCPKKIDLPVSEVIESLSVHQTARFQEWEDSLVRCKELGVSEEEVFYEHLLAPLWQIWRPLFERETGEAHLDLHKQLFFQKVIDEHADALLSKR